MSIIIDNTAFYISLQSHPDSLCDYHKIVLMPSLKGPVISMSQLLFSPPGQSRQSLEHLMQYGGKDTLNILFLDFDLRN